MSDLTNDRPASGFTLPDGDLWIFGYGSLMWRPGFEHVEQHRAMLPGRHRRLCVWSWYHRGLQHAPGLVMGLDRGGSCIGSAFRVPAREAPGAFEYLAAREMVTPVYRPSRVTLRLQDGRRVDGVTFTVDRTNPQYAGRLTVETAADTVRRSEGHSGHNADYVRETVAQLRRMAVRDPFLEAVAAAL
ncbi:gamma-glutamylcyclotransferase [Minwuia sp.]|uniref:gamma-glutamylcyclotransferase n=1 Tax=Minwuia sp. TaxID=2493630 RepID=UPI003A91E90D